MCVCVCVCVCVCIAQFVVHVRGKSQVSLQNINDPTLYLRISDSHQLDVVSFLNVHLASG